MPSPALSQVSAVMPKGYTQVCYCHSCRQPMKSAINFTDPKFLKVTCLECLGERYLERMHWWE